MRMHQSSWTSAALLTLASVSIMGNAGASGTTWRVTNDGTDSGSCGGAATPCPAMLPVELATRMEALRSLSRLSRWILR
jgi:hypothetical protein